MGAGKSPVFSKKSPSVPELFDLMGHSATGAKFLDRFIPKYLNQEILVCPLTEEAEKALDSDRFGWGPGAAAFVYDGRSKRIYLEMDEELGLLVPLFFHEIVHSLDEDYLASYQEVESLRRNLLDTTKPIMEEVSRRTGKPKETLVGSDCTVPEYRKLARLKQITEKRAQIRTFKSERKAYLMQYQLTGELVKAFPDYKEYLIDCQAKGYQLTKPFSDQEILSRYELKAIA